MNHRQQAVESCNIKIGSSNTVTQLLKQQCKSCLEEIDPNVYQLPCKCLICGDCCLQYLLVQIDHIDFYIDKDIKCPNDSCRQLFKVHQLREHFIGKTLYKIPQIDLLDEKLLVKHLQNDPLARNCPNSKCNYYGLLPQNTKSCKNDKLQCEVCKTEWKDKTIQSNSRSFFQRLKQILLSKNELFSEVHKRIVAKRCPRCAIPITKYGGCYHMICRKCNFEFCWYCCQQYSSHSIQRCLFYIMIRNSTYLISLILIIYLTGLYLYILKVLLSIVTFIITAIAHNILLLLLYLLFSFVYEVIKISNKISMDMIRYGYDRNGQLNQRKRNIHLTILTGVLFFIYLYIILYFNFTLRQIIMFIILETICFSTLYVGYNSMCFIWETWMRYIY